MSATGTTAPYLSVVATARNDDHGGNLLHRMQIFVDAWISQAKRHGLSSELILVEWNPPRERKPLSEALRWPADAGPCEVRIVEVPPELHARYRHAAALPLYQMIAKNVGIRRARGEFVLATNIDIIFSDELMQFLASGRLEKSRMYRIDRTDVMSEVPEKGRIEEQLDFCRTHLVRLCAREGTYKFTAEGLRKNQEVDIAGEASGIHCGEGFCPVERYEPDAPFRWIGEEAEIVSRIPPGGGLLEFEVEPGPGIGFSGEPMALQVLGWDGTVAAQWRISGRSTMRLLVPAPKTDDPQSIRLRIPDGGWPVVEDPRILNLRVFRCAWIPLQSDGTAESGGRTRPMLFRLLNGLFRAQGLFSTIRRGRGLCQRAWRLLECRGQDIVEAGIEYRFGDGWHKLESRGVERFRWASENVELAIRSTEGCQVIALLVEPGPGMGGRPFVLQVSQAGGAILTRASIHGLTLVEVPIPSPAGTMVALNLSPESEGRVSGSDPRLMNFRVLAIGGEASSSAQKPLAGSWAALTPVSRPPEVNWTAAMQRWRAQIAEMGKQEYIHMNACGDFTLMAREHWFDLRAYPEFDLFSMHLDSFLCWAAHFSGAREKLLREPMRIYHIEHGAGSGWTPEGENRLFERIARKGIQSISHEELVEAIGEMRRMHGPVIFNRDNWGLADESLREIHPNGTSEAARAVKEVAL
jgi:hypothetical protein